MLGRGNVVRDVDQGNGYLSGTMVRGFFNLLGDRLFCLGGFGSIRSFVGRLGSCVGCCGAGQVGVGLGKLDPMRCEAGSRLMTWLVYPVF